MDELRSVGWEDADIVHIVHVMALFNYMCRVANGLRVDLGTYWGWKEQSQKLSFKDDTAPKVFGKIAPMPDSPAAYSRKTSKARLEGPLADPAGGPFCYHDGCGVGVGADDVGADG